MPDAKTIRRQISTDEWRGTTVGRAGRYVQTGLVILRQAEAYDFLVLLPAQPAAVSATRSDGPRVVRRRKHWHRARIFAMRSGYTRSGAAVSWWKK